MNEFDTRRTQCKNFAGGRSEQDKHE